VIQAMCGLMDLTRAEAIPTKIGISIADTTGGMMGLFCILAMLELRDQTGRGCFIDLAMQDVGVWATHSAWQPGNRSRHAIVACRDGDVAAIAERDAIDAVLHRSNVEPKTTSRDDAVAALRTAGIPAASVRTIDEVGESEQQAGGFIRMVSAGNRRWPLLELPFRLSRMRDYELKPIGELGNVNAQFAREAS
jgi:crotonobetainyl-CoA:carnitine CoA-transferase CaiB-like acyl-CoA transferase